METTPLIVATTQRQIGWVLAVIVLIAMATYWLFNWLEGRKEAGAEIELAANRKAAMTDEEMETKRLDLSLTSGLVTLTIIAIALPLYWLGEPGRHSGLIEFTDSQFVKQGEELFNANCAQCHGSADGPGGTAPDYSLVDGNGVYVQQVQWKAPSLGAVLDRFSYDEVKYILNYGRSNSPMPAWGAAGGGPMTDQQIDKVIAFLADAQLSSEEIQKDVLDGLPLAALNKARADNLDLWEAQLILESDIAELEAEKSELQDHGDDTADIESQIDAMTAERDALADELKALGDQVLAASASDQIVMGELLFNNPQGAGAYGCARCHSAGWSYDAGNYPENPLLQPIDDAGGGFGPSLHGVTDQFETAESMEGFVITGTKNGVAYGRFGQGEGGGQMPGFGACWAEDNPLDFPRIQGDRIAGHCEDRTGILTQDQIAAIVAYERSLGGAE